MQSQNITDLESALYQQICTEWKQSYAKLKELELEVANLRDQVIEFAEGERMEYGVKVSKVTSKGKTNYKAIVEELGVSQEVLDKHTGMPESSWRVTKY